MGTRTGVQRSRRVRKKTKRCTRLFFRIKCLALTTLIYFMRSTTVMRWLGRRKNSIPSRCRSRSCRLLTQREFLPSICPILLKPLLSTQSIQSLSSIRVLWLAAVDVLLTVESIAAAEVARSMTQLLKRENYSETPLTSPQCLFNTTEICNSACRSMEM